MATVLDILLCLTLFLYPMASGRMCSGGVPLNYSQASKIGNMGHEYVGVTFKGVQVRHVQEHHMALTLRLNMSMTWKDSSEGSLNQTI